MQRGERRRRCSSSASISARADSTWLTTSHCARILCYRLYDCSRLRRPRPCMCSLAFAVSRPLHCSRAHGLCTCWFCHRPHSCCSPCRHSDLLATPRQSLYPARADVRDLLDSGRWSLDRRQSAISDARTPPARAGARAEARQRDIRASVAPRRWLFLLGLRLGSVDSRWRSPLLRARPPPSTLASVVSP